MEISFASFDEVILRYVNLAIRNLDGKVFKLQGHFIKESERG